ncbi:MAG: NADP-dependent malic enzyme [Chloroflexi bacterium]|nr:NADP-dependent malic enzyme [Chloroflexota bacterium]MCY4246826.1 NADP-dependent malic enzyme [Chloroflexota bacterium]
MTAFTRQEALDYHRRGRPGKIQITPTKPLDSQLHLSLAYSPGVAEAVLEIDSDPLAAYELTARANLVAVISNGSAILGLGDRGPLASKPVMEGKGVLFKKFADVDVFDIEINADTAEEVIAVCKALAPTFGGINLEDIKAPECFEIEERLKAELDIPVFHDDQHGTAIISGAALLNALEVTGKRIDEVKVVINGAGASAIATGKFFKSLGVAADNLLMADSRGVIHHQREAGMNIQKSEFAIPTHARTLRDALQGADVLVGLSIAGSVTQDMIVGMAPDPMLFVLANPTPEIMPELAMEVRPDAIIGTGRSDYVNQVNNVLGFPFIFRGALDVYATGINEAMKMAAARALAALAHEDVPDSVLMAYGQDSIKFGRDYLIPKPLDPRALLWVAPAVAEAAMQTGVARRQIDLDEYREELISRQGSGRQVRQNIINRARAGRLKRIVFPEGESPKIIRAAMQVRDEGIAEPVLLGRPERVKATIENLGLNYVPLCFDHYAAENQYAYRDLLYALRRRKGVTLGKARSLVRQRNYYACLMVKNADADAMVSGLTYEYPDVIRPALQVFGTRAGATRAAGVYLMVIAGRSYLFTDATVNIDPDAETLSEIAILANDFAATLGFAPRVAMLSFSNFGATPHPHSDKVRQAVQLVRDKRDDIQVDGEMQADTAVVSDIIEQRYPFSRVRDANVLVFPNLDAANSSYKLLSRLTNAEAIGPILLGMGAPVHVLQAGDDVEEIVAIAAVAAMDAAGRER